MGTSGIKIILRVKEKDHPHAYGDKNINCGGTELHLGSSPRVWGQAIIPSLSPFLTRIIPTRMGTSHHVQKLFYTAQDHPHAYGDKVTPLLDSLNVAGSSPRVWGQEIYDKLTEMRARIIPTRMGTSLLSHYHLTRTKDHPHAYGDKLRENCMIVL